MLISARRAPRPVKYLLAAALLALASAGAASAQTDMRVGVLLDTDDPFDAQRLAAMQLAASDYNEARPAGSPAVSLEIYDSDHGTALEALTAAHAQGAGPSIYLGPTYSGDVESIMGYVEENSLVVISPTSSATPLAVPGDGLFRLTPAVHMESGVLADFMASSGVVTALVAAQSGVFGDSVLEDMRAALDKRGIWTDVDARFEPDGSDWERAMDMLDVSIREAGEGAAVLVIAGFDSDLESKVSAASGRGVLDSVLWFVPSGALYPDSELDVPASGLVTLVIEASGPASGAVDDLAYSAGARPSVYDYSAYDSVLVAASALSMGGDAREAVPLAVLSVSGKGALGEIYLDAAGDLRIADYAVLSAGPDGWLRTAVISAPNTFCTGGPFQEGTCVRIGALVSTLDVLGDEAKLLAMRAAAADHNREQLARGPAAVYVDVIPYEFDPGSAAETVGQGVQGGTVLYAGPTTSPDLEDALSQQGIVLASPSSSASHLSLDDGAFRLEPTTARESGITARLVAGMAGSAVTVWQDDGFGRALLSDVEAALSDIGVEAVRGPGFDPRSPDWAGVMDELEGALGGARAVVFVGGFDSDFWPAAAEAAQRPQLRSVSWLVTPSVLDPSDGVPDGALDFAQQVFLTTTALNVEPNQTTAMLDNLLSGGASVYDYASYDAVRILAASAASAEGDLAEGARAAFAGEAERYVGALGDISLDGAGDMDAPISYGIWTVQNGEWAMTGTVDSEPGDAGMDDNMDAGMDEGMDTGMDDSMDAGMNTNMDDGADPNGGGCIVATAAYGTELAPQVQRLREVRESLAGTGGGAALLSAFNSVYYAAAPAVADAQRQSPELNAAVGAALVPVLAALEAAHLAGPGVLAALLAGAAAVPAAGAYRARRAGSL